MIFETISAQTEIAPTQLLTSELRPSGGDRFWKLEFSGPKSNPFQRKLFHPNLPSAQPDREPFLSN